MEAFVVEGGVALRGEARVDSAKMRCCRFWPQQC